MPPFLILAPDAQRLGGMQILTFMALFFLDIAKQILAFLKKIPTIGRAASPDPDTNLVATPLEIACNTQIPTPVVTSDADEERLDSEAEETLVADNHQQIVLPNDRKYQHVNATVRIGTSENGDMEELILEEEDISGFRLRLLFPKDIPPLSFPGALSGLGKYLQNRFQPGTQTHDSVMTAILIHRKILNLPSINQSQRAEALRELSVLYQDHFKWSRQRQDLEESVRCLRLAVELRNLTETEQIGELREHAVRMVSPGYMKTHAAEYLDHAILLYSEVMQYQRGSSSPTSGADLPPSSEPITETAPSSRTHLVYTIDELSYCYKSRYEQLRKVEDLDTSIMLIHEHMRMCNRCQEWHPGCRHVWGNLAGVYAHRFGELKRMDDLNETVRLYRKCFDSWKATLSEYPDSGLWHGNLANALTMRFTFLHDMKDLDEVVNLNIEPSHYFKPDDPRFRASLFHLGNALMIRGNFSENEEDIDRSIDIYEKIGRNARSNLSSAYDMRFKMRKKPDDWRMALELSLEELDEHQPGHPQRASALDKVAMVYAMDGAPGYDPRKALEYRLESLEDDSCSALSRLSNTAWMFNHVNPETLGDADLQPLFLKVSIATMRLLPRAASFGLDLSSRLDVLKSEEGVVTQAPSLALVLDQPARALELLEEGRGMFWTQALRLRAPFAGIPQDLRGRLVKLAHQLEDGSFNPSVPLTKPEVDERAAHMRQLSQEFNETAEKVRLLPGFDRFLLNDSADVLAKAAEKGPVVILIATKVSCDAIVIAQGGGIQRVKLDLTVSKIEEMGDVLKWEAIRSRDAALLEGEDTFGSSSQKPPEDEIGHQGIESEEGDYSGETEPSGLERHSVSAIHLLRMNSPDTLNLLWARVVKPVIKALNIQPATGRHRPRLWWCPTGPFTFLPIHAAGERVKGGDFCGNYVVSSYTPTLRSLLDARHAFQAVSRKEAQVLLAAVPKPYQGTNLPNTVEEVTRISKVLPAGTVQRIESEKNSISDGMSVQTMLKNLPKATIVHLACHGAQDPTTPLESGFIMNDGRLTISQLMPVSHSGSFMAFLSACGTAKGDKKQPDQSVHLAAAMLFAGFKSVVATMWSMSDRDGPTVAEIVYEELFAGDSEFLDPDDVAYALDTAVEKLRQEDVPRERWAPYIHIGI